MTAPTIGEPATAPAVPALSAMRNQIRDYDWGSVTALAQLQNRLPDGEPEAELWMGAHPGSPSELVLDGGETISLAEAIDAAPRAVLGARTVARFGARLPFLLKVLAMARPLSVQVHPGPDRAREVYTPDDPSPYVDPFHKPEMLYALEPTEALLGFRTPAQAATLLRRLGCERLNDLVAVLEGELPPGRDPDDEQRLHDALATLITWPLGDRAALVAEIATASMRLQATGTDYPEAFAWVDRLVGLHPADPMVLAPLLLDLVRLSPGQTAFIRAGVPHCYLSGMVVEILAASDNVLRAGLTSKPIEVEELLAVIDCRPLAPSGTPVTTLGDREIAWRPDVEDFQLARILVDGPNGPDGAPVVADASIDGPQILLCTRGKVQIQAGTRTVQLTSGYSAFVTAGAGPLTLSGGGEIFRAAPGEPAPTPDN